MAWTVTTNFDAQVQASQTQIAASRLVMITDAGQDLDDEVREVSASLKSLPKGFRVSEIASFHSLTFGWTAQMTMVLMRSLQDDGLVDCKGAVANLAPSRARARLVRGTLDELGLGAIPVAIGTDGGFTKYTASFEETACDYIAPDDDSFEDTCGIDLLARLYETASDGCLDLLCM